MVHRPDQAWTAGSSVTAMSSQTNPPESAGKKLTAMIAQRAKPAAAGWRAHAGSDAQYEKAGWDSVLGEASTGGGALPVSAACRRRRALLAFLLEGMARIL